MSDPMNEPSREPIPEPTTRMNLDAVLPFNLSRIDNVMLSYHSNQRKYLADQPGIDEEINNSIDASDSSQTTSIESSCTSLLAAHAKCLNQHESSCASLLAALPSVSTLMKRLQRLTHIIFCLFLSKTIQQLRWQITPIPCFS
jgi:hypothetical protein